jgi:hypothetical protein
MSDATCSHNTGVTWSVQRVLRLIVLPFVVVPATIIRSTAVWADRVRARILGVTLRVFIFNLLFRDRPLRLVFFFVTSFLINFTMALLIPLWMLAIGALIQGIPHLIASMTFTTRLAFNGVQPMRPRIAVVLGGVLVAVAIGRYWATARGVSFVDGLPNDIELAASLLAGGWLAWASGANLLRCAVGAAILGALGVASYAAPYETLGGLIIAHHFVGFIFWIGRAPTRADRIVALAVLALLSLTTLAVFAGLFDAAIEWRRTSILGGTLDEYVLGSAILPNTVDAFWLSRAVTVLAISQSFHYLTWFKAIPEQELPHQHPIGFGKAVHFLGHDVGPVVLYGTFYALAGLFIYAFLAGLPEARDLYLAGALFHGYFEIIGLAFIRPHRAVKANS